MVQIVPGQRLFRISGSVMKVDALNPKTYTVSAAAGADYHDAGAHYHDAGAHSHDAGADSKGLPETVQGQLRIPQTGA